MIELQYPPVEFAEPTLFPEDSYFEFLADFLSTPGEDSRDFITYFRAAVYNINFLSSEDPSRLHYHTACEILKEIGGNALEKEEKARELLTRELIKECQEFASQFIPDPCLSDTIKKKNVFFELHPNEQLAFSQEGRLFLDEIFSRHIAKIGPHGKELSAALLTASQSWHKAYLLDQNALGLFRLWVDLDIPPYYCRYLKLLAEILWKDRIEAQFQKHQKHIPALTQSVQRPLNQLLSPRASITEKAVIYEGKTIAEVPTIDPKLLSLLAKGMKNLNSIYHHKLLRYECKMGFDHWTEGKSDPRVLRYERGETELAEILGFKFKEAPSIIKSLLHAQAYMQIHFDDESLAPLITLRDFRAKNTNREEGLEIILSTQLMPNYTFQTNRRGRLLVPIPEWPPVISAPQYHAGQALLQMLIMEEFTHKSIEFSLDGSIEIPRERWDEFLRQSGLPQSVFKKACARWLVDETDGPRFLIQTDPNRFTLGESYVKELHFLKSQGLMRKDRQQQAQISVKKRRMSRLAAS